MQFNIDNEFLDFTKYMSRSIVESLANKYNFDVEEACKYLLINTSNKTITSNEPTKSRKKTIPMPFTGTIIDGCCNGIKLNYGLYTQCNNNPSSYNYKYPLCSTCCKQANSNDGIPTYGFIINRIEQGDMFKDPKGKSPLTYGNVLEKLKIDKETAIRIARENNINIPEHEFLVKKGIRGRPRKDTTASDTSSECSDELAQTKKPRGRPKKIKETIHETYEPYKPLEESTLEESTLEGSTLEESTQQIECIPIKLDSNSSIGYVIQDEQLNDTDYLMSADKNLYHPSTYEHIGIWNDKLNTIKIIEDSDED